MGKSKGQKTGDELIAALKNTKKVLRDFKNNKATVQDLKDAEDRERVARDNRLNYHDEKLRGDN